MKKTLILAITFLIVISLIGCSDTKSDFPMEGTTSNSTNIEYKTIIDSYGREVELPATIERIVPLGNAPRMITYLGLADKVVGIPVCEHAESPNMAYAYVNIEIWKDLPNVGNDSLGAGEWYAEEIVACNPDVIICTYEKDVADNIQTQTGIPVISVTAAELFSEDYNNSLRILADACGVSDRAEELIAFIKECINDIENRTAKISDNNKPTVLGAGATFKGGHSIDGVYANYPVFKVLAANDVAVGISEKSIGLMVDKEQILAWDPDIIFFDANNISLVNLDYNENPLYFQQLKAVRNGELYQWPNSTWHWTNVEIPLVTAYYVGSLFYPEAFDDIEFEKKASEIFDLFLGVPDYLETLTTAGVGYGKVKLGE